jgi:organic radical activating enzyme
MVARAMSKSTFCVLPWNHLATHPHGTVSLCCVSDHTLNKNCARNFRKDGTENFLSLKKNTVDEIHNSDYFKQVRLEMLEGKEPKACHGCFDLERRGLESKRLYENKTYHFSYEEAQKLTKSDGHVNPNFQFVELRLGNICNLKCRTCNPASSSKWVGDYKKLSQKLNFIKSYDSALDFDWPEGEEFWVGLLKASPNMRRLYINGGEPMMIKKHWWYLGQLIERGQAQNIELVYSTNMTLLPDQAFSIWKEFKHVQINASIDDLAQRNTYIRGGANWASIETNLDRILFEGSKSHNLSVMIMQTVSAMNFYHLGEFRLWARLRNLEVAHNFVTDPDFLSPHALPLPLRQKILSLISEQLPQPQAHALNNLYGKDEHPKLWEQFKAYTRSLDEIRSEKFEIVFPQLWKALDENF